MLMLLLAVAVSMTSANAANVTEQATSSRSQMVHQFNIGLEEEFAIGRLGAVIRSINTMVQTTPSSTEHVMCLVEVWKGPATMRQLVQGVAKTLPFSINRIDSAYMSNNTPQTSYPTACSFEDFTCSGDNAAPILECLVKNCVEKDSANGMASCFQHCFQPCLTAFTNGGCGDCLVEMAYEVYSAGMSLTDAMAYCFEDTSQPWTNSLGMTVVANVPITLIETRDYPAFLASRGYLLVNIPSWNNTILACTHLSVTTNGIPYIPFATTPYRNWNEENLGQAENITIRLEQLLSSYPNQVLCGDFNDGPAIPESGVSAVVPDVYSFLTNSNLWLSPWTDTYIDQVDANPLCTACVDNFISPTSPPAVYDHVYVRGPFWNNSPITPWRAQRWFDTWVYLIDGTDSTSGSCILSPLSDHYAVTLCRSATPETACWVAYSNVSSNFCADQLNAASMVYYSFARFSLTFTIAACIVTISL